MTQVKIGYYSDGLIFPLITRCGFVDISNYVPTPEEFFMGGQCGLFSKYEGTLESNPLYQAILEKVGEHGFRYPDEAKSNREREVETRIHFTEGTPYSSRDDPATSWNLDDSYCEFFCCVSSCNPTEFLWGSEVFVTEPNEIIVFHRDQLHRAPRAVPGRRIFIRLSLEKA